MIFKCSRIESNNDYNENGLHFRHKSNTVNYSSKMTIYVFDSKNVCPILADIIFGLSIILSGSTEMEIFYLLKLTKYSVTWKTSGYYDKMNISIFFGCSKFLFGY